MMRAFGNFEFMQYINKEIYDKLSSAEKHSRTNFRNSGHEMREALEKIVEDLIIQNGKAEVIGQRLVLSQKMMKLKEMGLLPDLGEIWFECESGNRISKDYYDFIRNFGNACSHAGSKTDNPKINYENTIECLKGLHKFLKNIYQDRVIGRINDFQEDKMPIEEYNVYEAYVPADSCRSKCVREFKAFTSDVDREEAFYAILRLYNKNDMDETFLLRNRKCFVEASRISDSSVPRGMTNMKVLTPINSEQSSFYIISYIFNTEPHKVTEKLLKNMSISSRLKMCSRIVDCLNNLHNSEVRIYHRMLSFDSVYVCEFRNEWVPYIIKFDFAKIISDKSVVTVRKEAERAKKAMHESRLNKYLPPEWENIKSEVDIAWDKVDIYSLGVLISDILAGKINSHVVDIEELEEVGISEEVLDVIDAMRAEAPDARCSMQDVQKVFDCRRKWCCGD